METIRFRRFNQSNDYKKNNIKINDDYSEYKRLDTKLSEDEIWEMQFVLVESTYTEKSDIIESIHF